MGTGRSGARYGSRLAQRRHSVPEAVMRRCSLHSEASSAEQSPEPEPRRKPRPEQRPEVEPSRKHATVRTKQRVDANHNETVTTRSTKGVYVLRSTQCSTASSFRSDWTTTTACSSCRQRMAAASTSMASSSPPPRTAATDMTEAPTRLCVHCGRQATSSKPCTPRDKLDQLVLEAAVVQQRTSTLTRTDAARTEESDVVERRTRPVASQEGAEKAEASSLDARQTGGKEPTRKSHKPRLKDVPDEDAPGYVRMSPDLVSESEGTSTSFNVSLMSQPDGSPSPTPTPSPTTFRSRRPSSDRLSTPESLRSGPITDAISGDLNSGSSCTSPERSIHFSSPGGSPRRMEPPPPPRFDCDSSAESRTPTPPPAPPRHAPAPRRQFDDKVHVVSETSSFIILDELEHATDAGDADRDSEEDSDFNSHTGRTVRHVRTQQRTRANWKHKGTASFEVLEDDDAMPPPRKACRPPCRDEAKKGAKKARHCEDADLERDSLGGSVPDMFGVDDTGNVVFCETGVSSRRPSDAGMEEKSSARGATDAAADKKDEGAEGRQGARHATAGAVDSHAASKGEHEHAARGAKPSAKPGAQPDAKPAATDGSHNSSRWHVRGDACHGHSKENGFRETVRSDHHSEEQTYFCGVKEVYSVTTEKVEKWGGESREWLEKTTSHRIQHQHPHPHADGHPQQQRQYSLSNRINVANNNPILIASEILEIPADQRIRPGAFGQSATRQPDGDFSLPSIGARNKAAARQHDDPDPDPGTEPQPDPGASTAHVRFIEDNLWSGGRVRSIVADLAGSEPAEIQVAVPRYPAVPRSRSMVVNTSSGEEDEDDDRLGCADDDSDECLSCADSLESQRSPRSARLHDEKPVRGHVVLPERVARPPPQPRPQSPKSFFVSLAEEQASEDDVPVSARLPDQLREKLLHRHTMVKLQMAQSRRFLRTACDAVGGSTTRRRAGRGATVRVGVTHGKDSKVTVSVEQRGDKDPVKKDRPRPKREQVAPVVRVHKCHVDEEVKTSFKAKPYKLARISESNTEDAGEDAKRAKQAKSEVRADRARQHARATVRSRHRDTKDADKHAEGKDRSHKADKERARNGEKPRERSSEKALSNKLAKENATQSRTATEVKKTHSHVSQKNLVNVQRSSETRREEIISDLAKVAKDQHNDDHHRHHQQRREHAASKERARTRAVRQEHVAKADKAATARGKPSGEKGSVARKGEALTSIRAGDLSGANRQTSKEERAPNAKQSTAGRSAAETVEVVKVSRVTEDAGPCNRADRCEELDRVKETQDREENGVCGHSEHGKSKLVRASLEQEEPDACACACANNSEQTVRIVRVSQEPLDSGVCGHRGDQTVRRGLRVSQRAEELSGCNDRNEQTIEVFKVSRNPEDSGVCDHADYNEQTVRVVRVLQDPEEPGTCGQGDHIEMVRKLHELEEPGVCDQPQQNTVRIMRVAHDSKDVGPCAHSECYNQIVKVTRISHETDDSGFCNRSDPDGNTVKLTTTSQESEGSSACGHSEHDARMLARTAHSGSTGRMTTRTASHTIATQVSDGDMPTAADVHTQTTPRTARVTARTEVRSHVTTQQTTRTETKRIASKEVQRQDGEDGTRAHSAATTMHSKDSCSQAGQGKQLETETSILHDVAPDGGEAPPRTQDNAADEGSLSPAGSRGTSRATAGSPGPRRSGSGPRFRQRFEPIPEETRNGGDDGRRTELARVHSSSKARAALQQHAEDENADVLAMSKGWINFYLMKEHGDAEDGVVEDAAPVERMEYSMEIRAMPDPTPTPRGPVSAATSPLCLPAATTSTGTSPIPSARLRNADPVDKPRPREPPAPKATATKAVKPPKAAVKPLAKSKAYRARGVGTTDHEDASTNTMCGPMLPPRTLDCSTARCLPAPLDAAASQLASQRLSEADVVPNAVDEATTTLCGPMLPMDLAGHFSEAGVSACTHHTTMMSMSRRTVVTRRERMPFAHVGNLSDSMSTSSDSTEYMAPPVRGITDGDSTCSPCWRRAPRGGVPRGATRGLRGRGQGAAPGLYQHHVPPRTQPAGPPPRDGVGWTVTVAGAGANQQGDLEMRLSFPGDDNPDPKPSAKDRPEGRHARGQAPNMSAPPPGRWSLTIRNQLPGDGDPGQRGVSVSMTPATPQENRPNDTKGLGGGDGAQRHGGGDPAAVPSPRASPVIVIRRVTPSPTASPTVSPKSAMKREASPASPRPLSATPVLTSPTAVRVTLPALSPTSPMATVRVRSPVLTSPTSPSQPPTPTAVRVPSPPIAEAAPSAAPSVAPSPTEAGLPSERFVIRIQAATPLPPGTP